MRRLRKFWKRYLQGKGRALVLASVSLMFVATDALAAGGGEGAHPAHFKDINWFTWDAHKLPLFYGIINFAIFGYLIYRLAGKKIAGAFQSRHSTIKSSIAEAQQAHTKAKARYDEYRDKLNRVEEEVSGLIERTRGEGSKERDRIVENAEQYATQLGKDADTLVAQEERGAQGRLHQEVVREALASAESMLKRGLTDADQQRLFDEAIEQIEAGTADVTKTKKTKNAAAPRRSAGGAA